MKAEAAIKGLAQAERARRNLNPHAEARFAMWLWRYEYAAQGGGSMDFWDKLSPGQKQMCKDAVTEIRDGRRWTGGRR